MKFQIKSLKMTTKNDEKIRWRPHRAGKYVFVNLTVEFENEEEAYKFQYLVGNDPYRFLAELKEDGKNEDEA